MMSDDKIEDLTKAAETIYKYCDPKKGFYSGDIDTPTGVRHNTWNYYSGAKTILADKLGRVLTKEEVTILSLAIGFGATPCLTEQMRVEAMDSLWSRTPMTRQPGCFKPMMSVLTSFY